MKAHRFLLISFLLSCVLFTTTGMRPRATDSTIFVTTTSDEFGVGSACALREAIQAANMDGFFGGCLLGSGNDTIWLGNGTYYLSIPGVNEDANTSGDLDVTSNLTIRGLGTSSIIDGDYFDRVLDIHSGATVTLESLAITHGHAPNGSSSVPNGGGIRNEGSLTLVDVLVHHNIAGNGAGTGTNAASGGDGGGIYSSGSSLTIITSSIFSNVAGNGESGKPYGFGGEGGGIYANDDVTLIIDSTIRDNLAGDAGASSTTAGGGAGGGIYTKGDTSISGCAIYDNTAGSSTTSDGGRGGGIYAGGNTALINTTISGNIAGSSTAGSGTGGSGGGLVASYHMSIRFSTIYDNHTGIGFNPGHGGGILSEGSEYVTLGNSISAGNTAGLGPDCYSPGNVLSEDYNLLGNATGCTFSGPTGNSLLGVPAYTLPALANNGGPTWTHALLPGNQAIDAANPSVFPGHDQRGYFRPVDGASSSPILFAVFAEPGIAYPDIGAFEQGSFPLDLFFWLPAILKAP